MILGTGLDYDPITYLFALQTPTLARRPATAHPDAS
jgi:hypothetical protein